MSQINNTGSFVIAPKETGSPWRPSVLISVAIFLASGTMNTISFKLQNQRNFQHGVLQTSLMFIGEYNNLFLFGLSLMGGSRLADHFSDLKRSAAQPDGKDKKLKPSILMMGFAAFFDSIGSSLQIVSLLLIPASVNQMLVGGVIIFTCLFSRIFLGRKVHPHHYLGMACLIIGFIAVGYSSILKSQSEGDNSSGESSTFTTVIGILMVLASLIIQAFQYIYEEMILLNYQVLPMRMVGIEGMFGMIFIFNWMMIFSYVPCPSPSMCDMGGYFEDPVMGIVQIFSDPWLAFWCFATIVSIMFFNLFGLKLTYEVSAMFRAFWSATRTITIWVCSFALGLETFVLVPFIIQAGGFVFLLLGNFIYNELVVIPFLGLDSGVSKNQVESQGGTDDYDSRKITVDED